MSMFSSKKIRATILGIAAFIIDGMVPIPGLQEAAYSLMAYVLGQGMADVGKEAAKAKA